jgi:hypothetical protein
MADYPFETAFDAFSEHAGRVSDLAHAFTRLLPVTGASISTLGPALSAETVSATDPRAERLDELQFDLGEGPCWDAVATRQPVLEPDLVGRTDTPWPAFSAAAAGENIGALFAFPLVFGPIDIGAIDLYSTDPLVLTLAQQRQMLGLSARTSRIVLRHAIQASEIAREGSPLSRREIHQATGMVLAQLGTTAADAYLLIQARAFAEDRSMQEVAADVVERRLRFTTVSDGIGDGP